MSETANSAVLEGQRRVIDANTALPSPPIPACHIEAARRYRRMIELGILVKVPHDPAEDFPDPDYGL